MVKSMLLANLALALLATSASARSTPRIRETTAIRAIRQRVCALADWTVKLSGPRQAFKRAFSAESPHGFKLTGVVDMRVHVPHSPHWRPERVKVDFPPNQPDNRPTWTGFRWLR